MDKCNETPTSIKFTEEMLSRIDKVAGITDSKRSEIIKACVELALPIIESNHYLVNIIEYKQIEKQ